MCPASRREEAILAALAELTGHAPSHYHRDPPRPPVATVVATRPSALIRTTTGRVSVSNVVEEDREQDGAAGRALKQSAGRTLRRKRKAHSNMAAANSETSGTSAVLVGSPPFGQLDEEPKAPNGLSLGC